MSMNTIKPLDTEVEFTNFFAGGDKKREEVLAQPADTCTCTCQCDCGQCDVVACSDGCGSGCDCTEEERKTSSADPTATISKARNSLQYELQVGQLSNTTSSTNFSAAYSAQYGG